MTMLLLFTCELYMFTFTLLLPDRINKINEMQLRNYTIKQFQ
jgi:hypothetical protein